MPSIASMWDFSIFPGLRHGKVGGRASGWVNGISRPGAHLARSQCLAGPICDAEGCC